MAPQFPEFRPEKVIEGLTAFPPKLSILAEPLTAPEEMFEQQASAAGLPIPPGPTKMAMQFMQSIEAMALPMGFGPPTGEPTGGGGQGQGQERAAESLGEAKKVEVEMTPKKSRLEIEILEA